MKPKFLFLASLLALTACGGEAPMSDITAGDEVDKASFEAAYLLNNIFLHSNYHVEVSYVQSGLPSEEAKVLFSKSLDFADKKIKVKYNLFDNPYYFDFSRSNDSASYTFDLYTPDDDHAKDPEYNRRTLQNISLSNDFMGITDLLSVTSGCGISLMSGLRFSDFTFNGGIYSLKESVKDSKMGVEATYDMIKASFFRDNIKEFYYHLTGEIPVSDTETATIIVEEKATFSQYGQVSVTLPEVTE